MPGGNGLVLLILTELGWLIMACDYVRQLFGNMYCISLRELLEQLKMHIKQCTRTGRVLIMLQVFESYFL